ncbi:MAG: DUF4124 domain-containing protein, partial [Lysobacteraceae bacterium]
MAVGGGDDRVEAREQARCGEQVGQQVDGARARRVLVFVHASQFSPTTRLASPARQCCNHGHYPPFHLEAAMRALSAASSLTRACTLLLLAVACAPVLAGTIYQWKDAKGVTHYSDSPPPNQRVKDRRIDSRGEPLADATAVGKSVENPQCTTARLNLQILAGNTGVQQDTDGDGKP